MEDVGRGPDFELDIEVEHPVWLWLAFAVTVVFIGGITWLIAR